MKASWIAALCAVSITACGGGDTNTTVSPDPDPTNPPENNTPARASANLLAAANAPLPELAASEVGFSFDAYVSDSQVDEDKVVEGGTRFFEDAAKVVSGSVAIYSDSANTMTLLVQTENGNAERLFTLSENPAQSTRPDGTTETEYIYLETDDAKAAEDKATLRLVRSENGNIYGVHNFGVKDPLTKIFNNRAIFHYGWPIDLAELQTRGSAQYFSAEAGQLFTSDRRRLFAGTVDLQVDTQARTVNGKLFDNVGKVKANDLQGIEAQVLVTDAAIANDGTVSGSDIDVTFFKDASATSLPYTPYDVGTLAIGSGSTMEGRFVGGQVDSIIGSYQASGEINRQGVATPEDISVAGTFRASRQ